MKSFIHHSFCSYVKTFTLLFLLCQALDTSAQTCNGTWGPPIINQTFGEGQSGTQFFGPLSQYAPGATTSTQFTYGQISDNYSCLSQNASVANSNGWISTGDHTGDPNGLMFLINAPSTAATVFFEYTMNDLCPNTALQFSVWILNVNDPSLTTNPTYQYPNMQINLLDAITGAVIATTSTGNIPADKVWHNYTIVFNNGTSSGVKMQLVNYSVGSGYGNDLALDDITVRPCVPITHISPKLDTVLCTTHTFNFKSSVTGNVYTTPEYLWQSSSDSGKTWQTLLAAGNNPSCSYTPPATPGAYWVRFLTGPPGFSSNANCVAVSDTTKIGIAQRFKLDPIKDTEVCSNGSVQLNATGASSYSWSPSAGLSCTKCANPIAAPAQTTVYQIVGSDNVACFDTTTMAVRVDTPILIANKVCPGVKGVAFAQITGDGLTIYNWFTSDVDLLQQAVSRNGDTLANLAPGDYIVNMHINNICDTTFIFSIKEYVAPMASFDADSIMCINAPKSVVNHSVDYTNLTWDLGNGTQETGENPPITYNVPGDYIMSLYARNENCADTATHNVSVKDFHLTLAVNSDSVVHGQPIILQTSGTDDYTIASWQPAELFLNQGAKDQQIIADENHTYVVWAASQFGCIDSASASVAVKTFWFIPSAFTPNGDGKNDHFKPIIIGDNAWDCSVFDRWGKIVYHGSSADITAGWDGTNKGVPANMGVYFYVVNIDTRDGERQYKGEVTLIR